MAQSRPAAFARVTRCVVAMDAPVNVRRLRVGHHQMSDQIFPVHHPVDRHGNLRLLLIPDGGNRTGWFKCEV